MIRKLKYWLVKILVKERNPYVLERKGILKELVNKDGSINSKYRMRPCKCYNSDKICCEITGHKFGGMENFLFCFDKCENYISDTEMTDEDMRLEIFKMKKAK